MANIGKYAIGIPAPRQRYEKILRGTDSMKENVYIAPNATIVGDVALGKDVSIWYGAVLRGDSGEITVGQGTNIQDNCVIHEKTSIGAYCTVGHGAIVHGCTIGDGCIIGMGSIILNGAVLEEGCLVGAGAVVTGKTHAPAGSVLLGSPAKVTKTLSPEQMAQQRHSAEHYIEAGRKAFG